MRPLTITIVGAGASAPRLCEALASTVAEDEVLLRLSARRVDRLRAVVAHARERVAAFRAGWSVEAALTLDEALQGAALVALLIRVGGLEARARDETFPRRWGLVGDEGLGPGGMANAWRTVPELAKVARTIRAVARRARVLNLMAPLGITTRLLAEQGLDAIGLCELPLATLEQWLGRVGVAADEPTWRYGGLNHLGWFWDLESNGVDLLRRLAETPMGVGGAAPVDRATLERFGAAPLRYYYDVFDPDTARRHGLARAPGRARELMALSETMIQHYAADPGATFDEEHARPTPWLDRAVAPIASALLGGPPHRGFVNLTNAGILPELSPELIVEVAAEFTSTGARAILPGPLPREVARFLQAAGNAEDLTFHAARDRDPDLLAAALRALPLGLPERVVPELVTAIREQEVG